MDISKAIAISAADMDAQGKRVRAFAENLANDDPRGPTSGADPDRCGISAFGERLDRELRADKIGLRNAGDGDRANLKVVETTRTMLTRTIELLR